MSTNTICETCGKPKPIRPPQGAALSDIRAWDKAQGAHYLSHGAVATHTPERCAEHDTPAAYSTDGNGDHWHVSAADARKGRGRARVCGDCWYLLRPGDYAPERGSSDAGECSACGEYHWTLYRVSWAEIDAANRAARAAEGDRTADLAAVTGYGQD